MTQKAPPIALSKYESVASRTDQFEEDPVSIDHLRYGFFGEVGSLLAAVKKFKRDTAAPSERESAEEELGDALWYLTALIRRDGFTLEEVGEATIQELQRELHVTGVTRTGTDTTFDEIDGLLAFQSKHLPEPKDMMLYRLATQTSVLFQKHSTTLAELKKMPVSAYAQLLGTLSMLAAKFHLSLNHIASWNMEKTQSRWPEEARYIPLFDAKSPEFEQLPRIFEIRFIRRQIRGKEYVVQQLKGINLGDPLTDNRTEGDDYRYHDVFHLAYLAHLGWSPVMRGLLKLKRKSDPDLDENQDGARAMIIEEGVATWVFNHARSRRYFADVKVGKLEYSLLKQIKSTVAGYEVDQCPLWQWELAILDGFRVFRELTKIKEGVVSVNLDTHTISLSPLSAEGTL